MLMVHLVRIVDVVAGAQLVNVRANDLLSSIQVQLHDVVHRTLAFDHTAGNPGLGVALVVLGVDQVIVLELALDGAMPTVELLVLFVIHGDRCSGSRLPQQVQCGANRSSKNAPAGDVMFGVFRFGVERV